MAEAQTPATTDEDEGKSWEHAWSPPPWNARQDDETSLWQVVCDGYTDETPIICAGTPEWPLDEADAIRIAAVPQMLDALEAAERALRENAQRWHNRGFLNHSKFCDDEADKVRATIAAAKAADDRDVGAAEGR